MSTPPQETAFPELSPYPNEFWGKHELGQHELGSVLTRYKGVMKDEKSKH